MHDWIVIVGNEVIATFKNRTDAKLFAAVNADIYPQARIASITALITT